jgi:hypothetical protein
MTMRTVLLSCVVASSMGVVPGPPLASAAEKAKEPR